ncbi:MAG: glycoside hydrolase family 10 protein [Oculatellaceae cyanobacterium bins.114]|nr:glycoside hydrolase family 10 protein [Oculatellaceae cyanobacterium bins.114]
MNLKRRFWLVVLVISLLVSFTGYYTPINAQPAISTTSTELRGVWLTNIDSDVLFSQRNLSRALRRLRRLNFNTVYPTVWNWGHTLYPSAIAQHVTGHSLDPHPGLQGRDMLAEIVEQGHRLGMTVIPWFEFGLMAPADSDLAKLHPDWLTQRRDGSQIVYEGSDPRVWLNPMHPEVQQFIMDLVSEIVTRYDVDGLQLDDHFGMPVELGYDPYTVRLYQEQQGQLPPDNPQDPAWKQWRSEQITRLMAQVFEVIKQRDPECIVALSPNPRAYAYDTFLQDWGTWERRGWVEELIVQVYRNDLERFVMELERPEITLAKNHIPVGIGILTGLRNRPVEMAQIARQVQAVRDRRLAGVSFFFYETLGNRDAAFRALFPTTATRPSVVSARGR